MSMRSSFVCDADDAPHGFHAFYDLTDDRVHLTIEGGGGYVVDIPLGPEAAKALATEIQQLLASGWWNP